MYICNSDKAKHINTNIMNYDDWKQQVPDNDEYDNGHECPECGARVNRRGENCSQECQEASDL